MALWKNVAGNHEPYLQEVGNKVTTKIGLCPLPDVPPLQQAGNAVQTKAADSPPAKTARVDSAVAHQIPIFIQAVVGLAEGDARTAAGNEAGIDRIEAAEERG